MKINLNQTSPEELRLCEEYAASALDLETDLVKFSGPLRIEAVATRITNVVTVKVAVSAELRLTCGRCLDEFTLDFRKALSLNYPVSKFDQEIILDQDIREEVIVGYPIKPLCAGDCKGLCPKCGSNLNEADCGCNLKGEQSGFTKKKTF